MSQEDPVNIRYTVKEEDGSISELDPQEVERRLAALPPLKEAAAMEIMETSVADLLDILEHLRFRGLGTHMVEIYDSVNGWQSLSMRNMQFMKP